MKNLRRDIQNISFKALFLIGILFLSLTPASAAQWEVGSGELYATIQSAIDNSNTLDGDVINVHSGTYTEDVVVNKKLTIKANTGDEVELKAANTGFRVVNDTSGDGSGSTIDGFKINSSSAATGVNISANNCTVKNNEITGGKTGVVITGSNNTILDNVISHQSETGILGNLTGGFCTISGNYISNIIGQESVNGITISINGSLTDLNVIGNIISNISASGAGGSVFGIQLGKSKGADGNPEVANVTNLRVTKNVITGISATSSIMGMELVSSSANALILENELSKLTGSVNSSVFGLEAAIIGNGTVLVSKNRISQISADKQAVGIIVVALGDLKLQDNTVSNIRSANATVGILGLGLLNNASITNNTVSNLTSPNIAAGIVGAALTQLDMLHNTVIKVNGANDISMIALGFNTTTVRGNNLEGDGSGSGIVICSHNGTINYNRIVNFEYYIQNFKFSSFGYNIDEMLKPLDDAIKNHPELEPILKPIRDDLDKLFHQLENSNTTATYNWYGTNSPDVLKFYQGNGTLNYAPWLILSVHANPSTIKSGQTSIITADVYKDSAGGDHSADAAMFFSGPQVTFTTTLGNVGSKSIVASWINGLATAILRAGGASGVAEITAGDYQRVQTFVTILGSGDPSTKSKVNAQTVPMQNTGMPVAGVILSLMMILSGFIGIRKK